jgi:ABC-2 type transport system ATP-binding protein
MMNAIETIGLTKTFGDTRALHDLSLSIRGGCVYGLLGPNGAGKTTVIRVLTTLLKPNGGSARVLGLDVVRDAALVRQKVSLTGQYASVDEDLTGHENLVLVSRLLGMSWTDARKRSTELLLAFGLADAAPYRYCGELGDATRNSIPGRADDGSRPTQSQPGVGLGAAGRR